MRLSYPLIISKSHAFEHHLANPIVEIMRSKDKSGFTDDPWKMLRPLARDIDYFAFLIITGEIRDQTLLSYYKSNLSGYIEAIMKDYASAKYPK